MQQEAHPTGAFRVFATADAQELVDISSVATLADLNPRINGQTYLPWIILTVSTLTGLLWNIFPVAEAMALFPGILASVYAGILDARRLTKAPPRT